MAEQQTTSAVIKQLGWLIGAVIFTTILSHGLATTYQADNLRRSIADEQMRLAAESTDFNDYIIIDIDDLSLDFLSPHYGQWPYERSVFAELHDYLSSLDAAVITYTPLFVESRVGDLAFAEAIANGPAAVLAISASNSKNSFSDLDKAMLRRNVLHWQDYRANTLMGLSLPVSELTQNGARIGLAVRQLDEVVREVDLVFHLDGATYDQVIPSLPLAATLAATEASLRPQLLQRLEKQLTATNRVLPKFPSNPQAMQRIPLWQLMFEARDRASGRLKASDFAESIAGRIVIIGTSASSLDNSTTATPVGRLHTHELTTNLIAALRNDELINIANVNWVYLLGLFAALLPLLTFRMTRNQILALTVAGLISITMVVLVHWLLYWRADYLLDPIYPLANAIVAIIFAAVYRSRIIESNNRRLAFERQTAERTSELKSQFLATITHELRTPLTSVLGYNRVLLEDRLEEPREESSVTNDTERYHKIIDANCRHLLTLINNLLSEAEIEAGQVEHRPTATRPREVLTDAMHSIEGLALDKSLALDMLVEPSVPTWLWLDGLRLRQVIINLASNAVKYTSEGRVTITARWSEGELQVSVLDTGPGMTANQLELMTQRFGNRNAVRLDSSGLGLSICNELINVMQGRLELESAIEQGSCFHVYIPAVLSEAPKTEAFTSVSLENDKASGIVPTLRKLEILVVDDNPDIRMLMDMYLAKAGHNVMSVETGEQAVEQALQKQPDIVFMDLNLPGISGREAVQQLRAAYFVAPIVLCSAAADIGDVPGINGYLPKPMRRDELLGLIEALVTK